MSVPGYGLIGCGAFGRYCLTQYAKMQGLRTVAVADANAAMARWTAEACGLEALTVDELLSRPDIHWVHVATPPGTHRDLVVRALMAGKNVLCEKPLSLDLHSAREMADLAKDRGLVLAVNLIMRYNPLAKAVHTILSERLLGEPLHASFENWAQDETLGPDHWFWDRSVSGGIFIEHTVHFFDLFSWWLGEGRVLSAWQGIRPGTSNLAEAVLSTSLHSETVPLTMYHGFHQPGRLDRQQFRILCERGDITLDEWVPTRLTVDGILDHETRKRMVALIPLAEEEPLAQYDGEERCGRGRHRNFEVDGRWRIVGHTGMDKDELYGSLVRELLQDRLTYVATPSHRRRVSEENGVSSLAMAVSAAITAGAPMLFR